MAEVLRDTLIRQFGIADALLRHHLDGLSTQECLWTPAMRGLTVRRDPSTDRWLADWPEEEGYSIGPPSAGWTTWHLGYWLSTALDHNFGQGSLSREDIAWPGSGPAAGAWITDLVGRWLAEFESLTDGAIAEQGRSCWPREGRSLADILAWSSVELAKNAAELGMARFLFATRGSSAQTAVAASFPNSAK